MTEDLQRDLGRLEGKVDSILMSIATLTASIVRSDAEHDNLARDMTMMRRDFERDLSDLKSKLYWLAGLMAAGGFGLGAAATSKAVSAAFGFHG